MNDKKRTNLMLFHLSPLLGFVMPLLGIVIPLVVWLSKKSEDEDYNFHGREILNFQFTFMLIGLVGAAILGGAAFMFFNGNMTHFHMGAGGIIGLLSLAFSITWLVLVITNSVAAYKGQPIDYKISIRFIKS